MLTIYNYPINSKPIYYQTNFKANSGIINREMEMIPKILELAIDKGGNDRFNSQEIKEITDKFAKYVSAMYKPDYLKSLLRIGQEKGTMLSAREIKNVLEMSSELTEDGQNNIIRFVKYLKEREYIEYTAEYIKNNHTFEKYKEDMKDYNESEDVLKIWYKNRLTNELSNINDYNSLYGRKVPKTNDFFKDENRFFVKEGIAKCSNPEALAEIILHTGIHVTTTKNAENLVTAYDMSNGNLGLVLDLDYCFLPNELTKIISLLKENNSANLMNYLPITVMKQYENYISLSCKLNPSRKAIIDKLGLTDKIQLQRIEHVKSEDIMANGKRLGGSFEQGKRR